MERIEERKKWKERKEEREYWKYFNKLYYPDKITKEEDKKTALEAHFKKPFEEIDPSQYKYLKLVHKCE